MLTCKTCKKEIVTDEDFASLFRRGGVCLQCPTPPPDPRVEEWRKEVDAWLEGPMSPKARARRWEKER